MAKSFTCIHCGEVTVSNPRIKNQRYCSAPSCQNARKRKSEQNALKRLKSKTLRKKRNKRWRDTRPAHEYQKHYRETHPEYVVRNRELQKKRNNKKRQADASSMIVKTDALLLQPIDDGSYIGFKLKQGKIVKTDALMLQTQLQKRVQGLLPLKPG